MSGRRTRSTQSSNSRINDAQIIELTTKLQALLPEIRDRNTDKVSASKILQDICDYIRNLHREVDDLSEKLSEFLASADSSSSDQTGVIRSLLMQED